MLIFINMKYTALFICLLTIINGNGQSNSPKELEEMLNGDFKVYESDGSGNSLGLQFSIAYPKSYKIMPSGLIGPVVGLAKSIADAGAIRLYIDTLPNGWAESLSRKLKINIEEARNYPISEAIAKEQLTKDATFLDFKSGFILGNADTRASYVEYSWTGKFSSQNDVVDIVSFYRVYTSIFNNYEIKLIFARTGTKKDEKASKAEFENYKIFYDFVANSFVCDSQ
jgi:hypothetical protein